MCLSGISFAEEISPLSIQAVMSVVEPASTGKNFSLIIPFVTNKTISNWALGFYMPRTLNQLINQQANIAINPDLTIELCTTIENKCSSLYYVKKSHLFTSAGYTNILAPINDISLTAGKSYVIKINNSNQGAPTNYSAMPQSFFLIENESKITSLPEILPERYQISNYDESQVSLAIKQHHGDNWEKSKPLTPNNPADQFHLLPTPVSIQLVNQTGFEFIKNSTISLMNEFENDFTNKKILSSFLKQDLHVSLTEQKNTIAIIIKKIKTHHPEEYRLKIANNNITISASTSAGVFYAIQTLRQLWNQNPSLPSMLIEDYPRFAYRGLLLDSSRHFFTVAEIEKLIDTMAAQKLNTLHMHFADDEGWRLDISDNSNDPLKSLVRVGARRGFTTDSILQPAVFIQANLDISNRENFSSAGKLIQSHYPSANENYSGYYSKKDIKTLIAYANARQITIIPEIDLPGHARALIYSIPNIFKDPKDKSEFSSAQGYTDNVIPVCLYDETSPEGKKFTNTIDEIIKRINKLFANQSTIYHSNEVSLAGDEVSNQAWNNDTSCNGLWSSLSALHKSHHFFSTLHHQPAMLLSGWQQLIQNDDGTIGNTVLPTTQVAHIWVWEKTGNDKDSKGIKDAAMLANAGYRTVLAFADDTYFDLTYTPNKWEPGFKWGGTYLDTHAALHSAFDALQTENLINANQQNNLLGIEGTLWTENFANFPHLVYMAMPKMAGLAEAAWTSTDIATTQDGKLNWKSLVYRLGFGTHGFLSYFYKISHLKYRGYPDGISQEVPAEAEPLNPGN